MRKLISSLALFTGFGLSAQNFCHTTEMQNAWFSEHPELRAAFDRHQQAAAELDRELFKNGYNLAGKSAAAGNYTIPVVFHILHLGGTENISDAQVIDAVNILTRDFNATNADTSDVVAQFKHFVGNAQFDFMLATKDPNGNCTNGIIRHFDANTDWSGSLSDYAYSWPSHRYLNIYVVRTMGGGAAGYTFLPGSGVPAAMDAIVILNSYVGSIGSGSTYTSRALTHEVGHWFNLPHVWGGTNQPGVACGDDGVSDTPVTKGYSSCNLNNTNVCTPGVVENIQNYMEYAYCQKMYTHGQAIRMQNAINSAVAGRNNLSTAGNLSLTGITSPGAGCIPGVDILATPSFTVCSGKTLTAQSFTFNANPTSYSWTADNSATVINPGAASTPVLFNNPGITHIICTAANINGSSSKTLTIYVLNGATQISSSNTESFEGSSVAPPVLWKVISPTSPAEKWEVTNAAAADGTISMYAPGEILNPNSIVILESPSYDFKHNQGLQFSFKYAYAKAAIDNNDIFKVQASKNCGGDWTDVWTPTNSNLAAGSGETTSDLYIPASTHWKLKNLTQQPQFAPFLNEDNVLIRFYFQENVGGIDFGNRFYLDNIRFAMPTGVNELTRSIELKLYPNPAHSAFNLSFRLSDASKIKYQVCSVTGAVLMEEHEKNYAAGSHVISINSASTLSAGIYFINLELNGVKMSRKVVVE